MVIIKKNKKKMDDTIAKLLQTFKQSQTVENPVVTTVEALRHDYRHAVTRNMTLAAAAAAASTQIEARAGELDIDSLINDAYSYNYRPPEDNDYTKLKKTYLQLLKAYNANKDRLLTSILYNYKLSIVLNSQNKQREQSFPTAPDDVRDILRRHERILLATVSSVIDSSTLTQDQKEQILFQVKQAQTNAVAEAKAAANEAAQAKIEAAAEAAAADTN
jgi:hypothetical protein